MSAINMKMFHELYGDASEGEDTTKYFLSLLLFLFVLLFFQFDLVVLHPLDLMWWVDLSWLLDTYSASY